MSRLANTSAMKRGKRAPYVPAPASDVPQAEAVRAPKMRKKRSHPKVKGGKR